MRPNGHHAFNIIIIIMPGDPGLLPATTLLLSAGLGVVWPCQVAPWPTPVIHHVGFQCRIGYDHPQLDFSVAFTSHNTVINGQECSYITLPTLFSLFCHIIEPRGLLSYRDILPFVWWWTLTQHLLALAMLMSAAVTWTTHVHTCCIKHLTA